MERKAIFIQLKLSTRRIDSTSLQEQNVHFQVELT